MPTNVFISAHPKHFDSWTEALASAIDATGVEAHVSCQADDPTSVDYIAYARDGALKDFTPFTRLKAVFSMWAGIEDLIGNPTIRCPITRMVESGMIESMTEWVTGQVLRYHLGLDCIVNSQDGVWRNHLLPPLARHRTVSVLGLGVLGQSCARSLANLNFRVQGWSRTPRLVEGIDCKSGFSGLADCLGNSDIVVLLLPHTSRTENLFDSSCLARLKRGCKIINSGRGSAIDDEALIAAIDSGTVSHATLDVFRVEPLPTDHPFWAHPRITVSPHVAADTHVETAAEVIAENVRRGEAGLPYIHQVDRTRGY